MMRILLFATLVLPASLHAQSERRGQERPPCKRSVGPVALQLLGGVGGAWLGGMGTWSAIDDWDAPDRKVKGDAGYQPNANTAYALGSWVGSTVGVYGMGKLAYPNCGSLVRTAIGTGVISAFLLLGREEPYLPLIGVVFFAPLQSIAGTMAFISW